MLGCNDSAEQTCPPRGCGASREHDSFSRTTTGGLKDSTSIVVVIACPRTGDGAEFLQTDIVQLHIRDEGDTWSSFTLRIDPNKLLHQGLLSIQAACSSLASAPGTRPLAVIDNSNYQVNYG